MVYLRNEKAGPRVAKIVNRDHCIELSSYIKFCSDLAVLEIIEVEAEILFLGYFSDPSVGRI